MMVFNISQWDFNKWSKWDSSYFCIYFTLSCTIYSTLEINPLFSKVFGILKIFSIKIFNKTALNTYIWSFNRINEYKLILLNIFQISFEILNKHGTIRFSLKQLNATVRFRTKFYGTGLGRDWNKTLNGTS